MRKRLEKLINSSFLRNVIIMATGTAAAQIVSLLLQPVITRMYGPEAYGLMGVFMAIVGIVTPIAALTYPIAIVLPKNEVKAKGLIRISLYIAIGISFLVALILIFFNQTIVNIFQIQEIKSYLFLIPMVILFSGFLQVTEQWFIRNKQFGITAKVAFFQSLILNGSKVGIGIFYPVAGVLILITALGNGLKAVMMIGFSKKESYKQKIEVSKYQLPSLKNLAKQYKDFPKYRAPEVFVDAVSQSIPILMLTSLFGPTVAGFYSISKTVLKVPTQLIGKSVGDVFYPHISEAANNNRNLTELIKKATISLGALGLIPFGTIVIWGPDLFSFVFGEDWTTAGHYARWMTLGVFFEFMNRASVKALPVLSAQVFQLIYTIFMLITRVSVLIISYYIFASELAAIISLGVASALLNIGLIITTLFISKKYDKRNFEY